MQILELKELLLGNKWTLIGVLVLYLAMQFLYHAIKELASNISFRKKSHKLEKEDLINHHFFTTCNRWIFVDLENIRVPSNLVKEAMVKEILKIEIETMKQRATDFINEVSCKELEDKEEFFKVILTYIYSVVELYSSRMVEAGIPREVVKKYRQITSGTLETIESEIKRICHSTFYSDNYHRIYSILNTITSCLNVEIALAEEFILAMNGECKDLKFKGKKIGL